MRTADSTAVSLSVATGTAFAQKKLGFWARVGGVSGSLRDGVVLELELVLWSCLVVAGA